MGYPWICIMVLALVGLCVADYIVEHGSSDAFVILAALAVIGAFLWW